MTRLTDHIFRRMPIVKTSHRVVVAGAWVLLLGYCFWPTEKTPEERAAEQAFSSPIEARVRCEHFVRARLRSPSTAKFSGPPPGHAHAIAIGKDQYRATGTYDAQNAFGAMLRGEYVCDMRRQDDSTWSLVKLVTTR